MFKRIGTFLIVLFISLTLSFSLWMTKSSATDSGLDICTDYTLTPPFLTSSAPPLVLLVMGKNHKLYYEAYNDASDIDGDGDLDVGYDPSIDYYGYFNSYNCYVYDDSDERFKASANATGNKTCSGSGEWSGDFLNYLTMSRMDTMRKVLYGGKRVVDSESETVLERAFIPQDAHSWGKEYDPNEDGYSISDYTPLSAPTSGKRHFFASTTHDDDGDGSGVDDDPLLIVLEDVDSEYRIWDWLSKERPVAGGKFEDGNDVTSKSSNRIIRRVQVKVCDPSYHREECKAYPGDLANSTDDDIYKPVGLLQKYGEPERMYFGLLSGSYEKNTSGGVLRKNISSIADEVDATTGKIEDNVNGIIDTIDAFHIYDFDYNSDYEYGGGWETDESMIDSDRNFPDWGNPIAEMMYEGLRYFKGKQSPTPDYDTSDSGIDSEMGLPDPSWDDPYGDKYPYCSKAIMLVISDIYPSYDTDELPGIATEFGSWSGSSLNDFTVANAFQVGNSSQTIWDYEQEDGEYFIGQSGSFEDSTCSDKNCTKFKNIRGLCPEEPTKQGGYYSTAVSYYGNVNDLHSKKSIQNVSSYSIALSSPLPEINIAIGDDKVRLIPFGKSVGSTDNNYPIDNSTTAFQPTNTIVDYYVESINATSGTFRINFEDVEQGADHDMDAIVLYNYQLLDESNQPVSNSSQAKKVEVTITSEYAAGGIIQHLGYIISGTTDDGSYLVVRDNDTSSDDDVPYFLDDPYDSDALPLTDTRIFEPSDSGSAQLIKNPLWFASKWGGFKDLNDDGIPQDNEWDQDDDGVPDSYFYVQNPTRLQDKLNQAFARILKRISSGSAASVVSGSRSGEGALYQAVFWPSLFDDSSNEITWVGDVHGFLVGPEGNLYEDTNDDLRYDHGDDKRVRVFYDEGEGRSLACVGGELVNGTCTGSVKELENVNYLWSAAEWLMNAVPEPLVQRSQYMPSNENTDYRYLFTWFDADQDGVVDDTSIDTSGEVIEFTSSTMQSVNATDFCNASVVNWIRGLDQTGLRSRQYNGQTWRLGDVIHSTPAVVGAPMENYDLYWNDGSYTAFYQEYRNRRLMVYFGGNDGILHAVNGGFFNRSDKGYYRNFDGTDFNDNGPLLGTEMWGYVPYNLLPHLECLTDPEYEHKYYIDLHPRVFDVRIWEDEWTDTTGTHPNGWGTILVCGMRFGGEHVIQDGRDFSSSYMIFDITDPENPPELLGEVTYDSSDAKNVLLGYTTSVPSVLPSDPDLSTKQRWYLIFGSGPDADNINVTDAASTQKGKLAVVPLNELAKGDLSLKMPSENKFPSETELGIHKLSFSDSYVGTDLVAVDYDFDFFTDIYYYGVVSGSSGDWGGGLSRLKVEDEVDPKQWEIKEMIDPRAPVTAAPNIGWTEDQVWVYFGTGRFLTADDSRDNSTQYFFGIKEHKKTDSDAYNFDQVDKPNYDSPNDQKWIKSSDILVELGTGDLNCTDGNTDCLPTGVGTLDELETYTVEDADNGWFRELNATERVVGQATLLGGLVNYTTYSPSDDPCTGEGESSLYSVYYLTGTAWKENVYGEPDDEYVEYSKELGRGLAITPTMHLGSEEGGKVVVQTSTGAIEEVDQPNMPIKNVHSGPSSWHTHDVED